MLNFAQLSATLNLRAVMEKTHGRVDDALLGRLQNSASDRNWDKIRALWEMKEEVEGRSRARAAVRRPTAAELAAAPCARASAAGGSSPSASSPTSGSSAGTPCGATSSSSRPSASRWSRSSSSSATSSQSDYDYPTQDRGARGGHRRGRRRDPRGARGRGARPDARGARDQPPDGAAHPGPPLLHRPGRQRARPARAHRDRREARRAGRRSTRPTTSSSSATTSCGRSSATRRATDGRAIVAAAAARRASGRTRSSRATGSARPPRPSSPSRISSTGGFPDKFHRGQGEATGEVTGVAGSPGVVEGVARVVRSEADFDAVQTGDVLVCQMTNPAWQVLFSRITALVTDAGGFAAHPGGARPRVRDPGRRRDVGRDAADPHRRPDPGRRQRRRGRRVLEERQRGRGPGRAGGRGACRAAGLSGRWAPTRRSSGACSRTRSRSGCSRASSTARTRPGRGSWRRGSRASWARARRPSARRCATSRRWASSRSRRSAAPASAGRRWTSCSRRTSSAPSSRRSPPGSRCPGLDGDRPRRAWARCSTRCSAAPTTATRSARRPRTPPSTRTLVDRAGNGTLRRVWGTLEPYSRTYINMAVRRRRPPLMAELHRPILDALRSGDADAAEAAIRQHFETARRLARRPLGRTHRHPQPVAATAGPTERTR